jgi:isocitrate/isopropylmalate dehydrogenase
MCSSTPATCGGAPSRRSALEFPEVETAYQHVDAATIFLTTDPGRFDVIVTDNLFGDIITDIAAAIAGGIGLAASGNINPERSAPSMFEPVHGSAPDIAGQGKADPDGDDPVRRHAARPRRTPGCRSRRRRRRAA